MKKLIITSSYLLFLAIPSVRAQYNVPQGYAFNTNADYKAYEKDVIATAKWLEATPLDFAPDKRKDAAIFIMQWITGSADVSVELTSAIVGFENKNKGIMPLYMAAAARYVLEHNYSTDKVARQRAGLKAIIEAYKKTKGINKDEKMEELMKSEANGKLDEWIEKNMQG